MYYIQIYYTCFVWNLFPKTALLVAQAPQCPEGPRPWTIPKLPTASHIVSFYGGQNSVGWITKHKGKVICKGRDSFAFSLVVQFSRSVEPDSFRSHEPQHARPPCPSPTPRVHPNSCPLCRWCHPTISSSVIPFSSCPQSFPASGSFKMSQLFFFFFFLNFILFLNFT